MQTRASRDWLSSRGFEKNLSLTRSKEVRPSFHEQWRKRSRHFGSHQRSQAAAVVPGIAPRRRCQTQSSRAPGRRGATPHLTRMARRRLRTSCRVASIFWVQRDPGMRLGLPKARVRNAFTCAATPGPYMAWHGAFDGREVGHSNTRARAMRGAIASSIYDYKGLAARFWHGQSTRAERSYGRVHEHATQDRCSARYDAFWWARGCSLVQEMRALSEVPYVVSTFWVQRGPGRRLGGAKVSMRRVSVHLWVDAHDIYIMYNIYIYMNNWHYEIKICKYTYIHIISIWMCIIHIYVSRRSYILYNISIKQSISYILYLNIT